MGVLVGAVGRQGSSQSVGGCSGVGQRTPHSLGGCRGTWATALPLLPNAGVQGAPDKGAKHSDLSLLWAGTGVTGEHRRERHGGVGTAFLLLDLKRQRVPTRTPWNQTHNLCLQVSMASATGRWCVAAAPFTYCITRPTTSSCSAEKWTVSSQTRTASQGFPHLGVWWGKTSETPPSCWLFPERPPALSWLTHGSLADLYLSPPPRPAKPPLRSASAPQFLLGCYGAVHFLGLS